jgi:hypothetical protein
LKKPRQLLLAGLFCILIKARHAWRSAVIFIDIRAFLGPVDVGAELAPARS